MQIFKCGMDCLKLFVILKLTFGWYGGGWPTTPTATSNDKIMII